MPANNWAFNQNTVISILKEHRLFFFLIAIAFLFQVPLLNQVPLFDEDEGYFSEISREMALSGDFLTPRLNGVPEFDKPPLTYWAQAISITVFGENAFATRFPAALSTLLWVAMMFSFVKRHFDITTAFLSGLFLISSIQITVTGKAAIAEAFLNLFLSLVMFRFFDYSKNQNKILLYQVFFFGALGFMTKGPIAVVIPLCITGLYCFVRSETKFWVRSVFNPTGLLIFLGVGLPWYILAYCRHGSVFIDDLFIFHHVQRVMQPLEGHSGSFLYYIPVIILGTLPHSGLIIPLAAMRNQWHKPLFRFCLLWFTFVFIFFSLSATKLPHYLIYGYSPVFILYANQFKLVRNRFIYSLPPFVFMVAVLISSLFIDTLNNRGLDPYVHHQLVAAAEQFGTGFRFAMLILLLAFLLAMWIERRMSIKLVLAVSMIYLVLVNFMILPRVAMVIQTPIKEAAQLASRNNHKVTMWGIFAPSFLFYYGKKVDMRHPRVGEVVLTKVSKIKGFLNYESLYEKNGILLIRALPLEEK